MNLLQTLLEICCVEIEEEELANWFLQRIQLDNHGHTFNLSFGLIGRKISSKALSRRLDDDFPLDTWKLDQLCRLCLLLSLDTATNLDQISELAAAADMKEQVVIFKALPYLKNAEEFTMLAIDGIRTNITDVFDAIALQNTFPQSYFPEDAWNQMVLKAIFMERPIYQIIGLDKRKNQKLAGILFDFVHERWSAGRLVTPELWRLMSGFVNDAIFADLKQVIRNDTSLSREAAIKTLHESNHLEARSWLANQRLETTNKSWNEIGREIKNLA